MQPQNQIDVQAGNMFNRPSYKEGALSGDGIYDNWRLEGLSFVWYFRGQPHVHVWVNIAYSPELKLNSYQNSIGV